MRSGFYKPGMKAEQAANRRRWAEKSAVTKRAQRQKVSLARIPSMGGGKDEYHGPNPPPANLPVGSEGACAPDGRDARDRLVSFPRRV
jgi:hypothetical protein